MNIQARKKWWDMKKSLQINKIPSFKIKYRFLLLQIFSQIEQLIILMIKLNFNQIHKLKKIIIKINLTSKEKLKKSITKKRNLILKINSKIKKQKMI